MDTPPPTASGSLHIGHVFSYTQTDVVVRYKRMRGMNIFYPMGWDDNGLPTERRVQNYYHVRCDPNTKYEEGLELAPASSKVRKKPPTLVSRPNFIEACFDLIREDEDAFRELWHRLGLSVDWRQEYQTIDDHCRRTAQQSFLDLHHKGLVYTSDAPTMWDVDFQCAVAQAEVEDKELPGAYHKIEICGRSRRRVVRDRHDASGAAARVRGRDRSSWKMSDTNPSSASERSRRSSMRPCRSFRANSPIPRREPAS